MCDASGRSIGAVLGQMKDNIDTNTTDAPVEVSEEATGTDEPKEEVAADRQAEADLEDVEPSDQPNEESD